MTLVQAQALARAAFTRLWRSDLMTVRSACYWLLSKHGVEAVEDLGSVDQCERVVADIAAIWRERNATPCPTCTVPVREAHGHVILNGELYHANCLPPIGLL
jgi:hypothetical protein